MNARAASRIQIIDAFRGVAILSVLAFHYLVRWAPPENAHDLTGYQHTFSPFFAIGRHGVELFFVISGLVITMTVLKVQSAKEFMVHRFARLYPAFFVALCLTFLVTRFAPREFQSNARDLVWNLTMMPADFHARAVDGAYWSLAVEVKFYALVALSLVGFSLWDRKLWWVGVLTVAILSGIAKLFGHGASILESAYWPYFMLGMGAWYGLRERQLVPGLALGGTGLALYLLNAYPDLPSNAYIVGSSGALLGLLALNRPTPVDLLAPIGRISYSLYLIHQFIGVTVIQTLGRMGAPDSLAIIATLAFVMAAAWLMFRFVELPAGRLIRSAYDRFTSRKRLPRLVSGDEVLLPRNAAGDRSEAR